MLFHAFAWNRTKEVPSRNATEACGAVPKRIMKKESWWHDKVKEENVPEINDEKEVRNAEKWEGCKCRQGS